MPSHLNEALFNEEARLNALRDLQLLDTPPAESFDRITRLASRLLAAPVSTISLTDADRQWFKSKVGVDLTEIPRETAPCNYAIRSDQVFVVPDLLADARFRDGPLAKAGIRFYAGAPLRTRAGYGLGTLCVVDTAPRELAPEECRVLKDLAGMVMSQIELQNMIGRVDASSGLANQHQMFEDLAALAERAPAVRVIGLLVELVSNAQAGEGQRVLGTDYADALMRGAFTVVRRMLGNVARLYHVGTTRCAVVLDAGAVSDVDEIGRRLLAALHDPIDCAGVPVTPAPVLGRYAFEAGAVAPRDVLRRLFNAAEDARAAADGIADYNPARDQHHARRFALLTDFKAATTSDEQLSLVYQPRIALASGVCVGAEALLRWHHPRLGDIAPGEFVPVVEQTALARPMTDRVVAMALREAQVWKLAGFQQKISINASALNLDEPDFAARLVLRIETAQVEPSRIELEFTESAVARNGARVVEQLRALRGYGIDIAIDDFGTGQSNLAYLQQLPATVLKIDRAFVKDLARAERDRTLVRTMIAMARDLGYRVVAEGIEDRTTYDLLAEWGCDEGQGYLMSRPLTATAIREYLARGGHWSGPAIPRAARREPAPEPA